MKMRFWQKTYIFTLILFLICLNAGVLSLTVYTYNKNVETAEDTARAEQYYVAMSFERDYEDMIKSNSYGNPSLLMQSFGTHYASKGFCLAFEENKNIVYSNFKTEYDTEKNTLKHTDIDGKRHIIISSEICDGRYDMIFAKNVENLDSEFRSFMLTYVLTAAAVSLILALCLYFILKKLSYPLEKLKEATETIENGDFSVTVEEKGNDEFTLLARSFNSMLSKINEQMQALEKEAQRKQMLVDDMAHELRTPLTSIHGYAEYIEKANITDERKAVAARYIISEADRLQKISEILLDGAFIRENKTEKTNIDVSSVLKDVCEKLHFKAEKTGVDITCDVTELIVKGNETLLSMLFYNLIENAIKACDANGEVKVSCKDFRVIIKDNGKGMSAEQLSHITEPFYRTDKSRSRADGGAGLGLALCKQIADAHGAEMLFASELGKGCEISITFTT